MSAKKRNELRRFRAGAFEKVALAIGALGLIRPFFEGGLDGWSILALVMMIVFYSAADYLLRGLEDE